MWIFYFPLKFVWADEPHEAMWIISDSISYACCCKKAGLRSTPFHLLLGMRWKANIQCDVWAIHLKRKAHRIPPRTSPHPSNKPPTPLTTVSCAEAIFLFRRGRKAKKHISALSKGARSGALLLSSLHLTHISVGQWFSLISFSVIQSWPSTIAFKMAKSSN